MLEQFSIKELEASPKELAIPVSLSAVSLVVAVVDLICIVALSFITGFSYDVVVLRVNADPPSYMACGFAIATMFLAFALASQLYRAPALLRVKWQIRRCLLIWIGVFFLLANLVFMLKTGASFSRAKMVLFAFSGIMVLPSIRLLVAAICVYVIRSHAISPNQIIVIGTHEELASNHSRAELDQYGYAVAEVFQLVETQSPQQLHAKLQQVVSFVRSRPIDEVILALPWNRLELIQQVEIELRPLAVPVKLMADRLTRQILSRPLSEFAQSKAVELQRAPLNGVQRKLKRCLDQVLAAAGLFLLTPFMAVIALAIRVESGGPALFMQTRVGFNGQPFRIYKFRTMSTCDDGPVVRQATRNDARITHLGGLLRKLSIDEVPQLLNVVRGDMSLVGPRPHALAHDIEYHQLIATYAIRHKMKPGITGWAQVNGFRGETPEIGMMERRIESDIWYIEYWSLWLDIRILLLTIAKVLKSDNAY